MQNINKRSHICDCGNIIHNNEPLCEDCQYEEEFIIQDSIDYKETLDHLYHDYN